MYEAKAIEWLRRKVGDEGFMVMPQVGNGVGQHKRRTIDAIMVQTWPSRGLEIIGVEYKRTRGDWRRELRNGEKAETIAKNCHRFLLLAPKEVIPIEEVPAKWGLWEIDKRSRLLRTKNPPTKDDPTPDPTLSFMIAVLKAAENCNRNDAVLAADREKLQNEMEERIASQVKRRSRRYEELSDTVKNFENASGLNIRNGWKIERLGEGLKEYLDDTRGFEQTLKTNLVSIEALQKRIKLALDGNAIDKKETERSL